MSCSLSLFTYVC